MKHDPVLAEVNRVLIRNDYTHLSLVKVQTVEIILYALDSMPNQDSNADQFILNHVKIVNSLTINELIVNLIHKQELLDTLSDDPKLLSIMNSMTQNLKGLAHLTSDQMITKMHETFKRDEIEEFADLMGLNEK